MFVLWTHLGQAVRGYVFLSEVYGHEQITLGWDWYQLQVKVGTN